MGKVEALLACQRGGKAEIRHRRAIESAEEHGGEATLTVVLVSRLVSFHPPYPPPVP